MYSVILLYFYYRYITIFLLQYIWSYTYFQSFTIRTLFAVDHWQLRSELRAEQDSDGHVGHLRGAAPNVRRPEDHQARVQGHPAKQEDHRGQPGQARHTGQEDIQGKT